MSGYSADGLLRPNTAEALTFLHGVQPDSPWHLVAIPPDGKPAAKTFASTEPDKVAAWIDSHQGKANLYFHPNKLKPSVRNRKAKKTDVEAALMLHVDVDDIDALPRLRNFHPEPSVIIFSGGGYQAFWLFDEPAYDLGEIESMNEILAKRLGGDKCHNIDRIMRLPGTVNIPNAKKRARGRVPVVAHIVSP